MGESKVHVNRLRMIRALPVWIFGASLAAVMVLVACGQGGESPQPASSTTSTAQTDDQAGEGEEDDVQIAASLGYSEANNDVYQNLTQEQRAKLAPGLSPEELMALTPEQLAALSQAQQDQEGVAANAEEPTVEQATAVNTALGQINMEQITQAFENAENIGDFEEKINKIYEGDHVLLVQARNVAEQSVTEAWEDLNDNGTIEDAVDDLVFSFFVQRADQAARLVGQGANNHFVREFPPNYPSWGAFFRDFIIANLSNPSWTYITPSARRPAIVSSIRTHRSTPAWMAQRRATREYYRRLFSDPRYAKAIVNVSKARRAWRAKRRVAVPLPPPPPRMKIRRHGKRRVKARIPAAPGGVRVPAAPGGVRVPAAPGVKVNVPAPPGVPGVKVRVPPTPATPGVKIGVKAPPPPPGRVKAAPPPPPGRVKAAPPPPPRGRVKAAPPPPARVKATPPPPSKGRQPGPPPPPSKKRR